VLEAIAKADAVLLAPSNPVVSIGPTLSVPGVRDTLRQTTAPVVGLSPIVGGRPVRGMADACLAAIGVETSAAAVAGMFADVLDGWLVDMVDADRVDAIAAGGVTARAVPLLMSDAPATEAMAAQALALADELR
jgi:LPPG:FO 2-phospho-L-lactate transferase